MNAVPLSLYVHFPWCIKKCPYCDFNSHQQHGALDQHNYISALLADLDHDLAVHECGERELISIFLGGGTPSLFGGDAIARLLTEIKSRIRCADDMEVTMEANPGAVEHDDFAAYRAAGVTRLSLGAQSFNDAHLKQLGRVHSAAESRASIRAATDAGFDDVNLDLMYALPTQTLLDALADLDAAIQFAPTHLSLYQLTIEPNTWFHRHPPKLPSPDAAMDIQTAVHARAREHGYQQYEVSAHARDGRQCRHNVNYWHFGDYLAIGAGAHGKITRRDGDGNSDGDRDARVTVTRYWKQKHPQRYLDFVASAADGKHIDGAHTVTASDLLFELLMNALRLRDGVPPQLIPARTGNTVADAQLLLRDAIARGMVIFTDDNIRCSATGYLFLDEVLAGLLDDTEPAVAVR